MKPTQPPDPAADLRAARKEARELRKALTELSQVVSTHLAALDEVMKGPSTVERGRQIATLAFGLDYYNDQVRFGPLKVDFRKDRKPALTPEQVARVLEAYARQRDTIRQKLAEAERFAGKLDL